MRFFPQILHQHLLPQALHPTSQDALYTQPMQNYCSVLHIITNCQATSLSTVQRCLGQVQQNFELPRSLSLMIYTTNVCICNSQNHLHASCFALCNLLLAILLASCRRHDFRETNLSPENDCTTYHGSIEAMNSQSVRAGEPLFCVCSKLSALTDPLKSGQSRDYQALRRGTVPTNNSMYTSAAEQVFGNADISYSLSTTHDLKLLRRAVLARKPHLESFQQPSRQRASSAAPAGTEWFQ